MEKMSSALLEVLIVCFAGSSLLELKGIYLAGMNMRENGRLTDLGDCSLV